GAGLGQVGGVDAREAADLHVLGGKKFLPVEAAFDLGPAVALGLAEQVRELRGEHHELLGHAAAHHAGAADPVLLGDADARALHGRQPRRAHPAGAGADDEKVIIILSHGALRVATAAWPWAIRWGAGSL